MGKGQSKSKGSTSTSSSTDTVQQQRTKHKSSSTSSTSNVNPSKQKSSSSKRKGGDGSGSIRGSGNEFSSKKLKALFNEYCDATPSEGTGEKIIGPEGLVQFFSDIDVDPERVVVLVLAYHLDAKQMCQFTEEEFMSLEKFGVDSLPKIKKLIDKFEVESVKGKKHMKDIYRFTFFYAKDPPLESKVLDKQWAIDMIRLLLTNEHPHVKPFLKFLKNSNYRAVNLDQWMSFYEFTTAIKLDFSNYDENEAWPVLLDEFVAWKKENPHDEGDESDEEGGNENEGEVRRSSCADEDDGEPEDES